MSTRHRLSLAGQLTATIPRAREVISALASIPDTQGPIVQKRLQMPGESTDARAIRARDQIGLALLELAREKGYDDITVQDIARRAGVSRTTFYAHFQDRDGIMFRYSVVFGEYLGRQLRWDRAAAQYRFPIAPLFSHMLDIQSLYEALSRARRTDDLLKIFRINLSTWFEKRIESTRRKASASAIGAAPTGMTKVPAPLLAQHLAGTIVQLLAWWMEQHGPPEPQAMDEHFHRLVAGLR